METSSHEGGLVSMRFSVIVPLYNKAPYVKKALNSIIEQSFKDFELIVVDDGSHDESYSIAESVLASTNCCYQLVHQKNAGVSTARNNGVALSKGEYICFLDADDWWSPSFLEKMDGLIRAYPEAGIYGINYYYVKNGRGRVSVEDLNTGYFDYCSAYARKLQMPLWTGAVCLRRSVFDEMGGFRPHLKLGEDFDLWIKIALKYPVAFLNEPLSYYFQDSDMAWRGVGHLTDPQYHMLWNLDYLADSEMNNSDYKQLVDNLRTYNLMPYYLSTQYREAAKQELAKVDWARQPQKVRRLYRLPVMLLIARRAFLRYGSRIKQWMVR